MRRPLFTKLRWCHEQNTFKIVASPKHHLAAFVDVGAFVDDNLFLDDQI